MSPDLLAGVTPTDAARLDQIQKNVVPVEREIRDSFHTAPGFRQVAFLLSCKPDGAHPWNPDIVRKIWEFDKTVVPMWVRWVFAPPGKDGEKDHIVFGRHMIGRYDPLLKSEAVDFPCEMPTMPCQGLTFNKPNVLELPWMVYKDGAPFNSDYPDHKDLPGDYLPFDMRLVEWMRKQFDERQNQSAAEFAAGYAAAQKAYEDSQRASLMAEDEYRQRDLQDFVTRKLSGLSDVELKEHFLERMKKRATR